jgi:hypothetical protein
MLNRDLWKSFIRELSSADIDWIENRIYFLKDILEEAERQYPVEDVSSDLDLDIQQYLRRPDFAEELNISPWLIHDSWLYYYDDGVGLQPEIATTIKSIFNDVNEDLYSQIVNLLTCIKLIDLVVAEVDAAIVLSFMDYLATRLIYVIAKNKFNKILAKNA